MWIWLVGAAFADDCSSAALDRAIHDAEDAFSSMDASGFDGALKRARVAVGCTTDPLTPVQCAGYHRVQALDAFLRSDESNAILDFVAMRATQPGYVLPDTIAPEGHPLRDVFEKSNEFASTSTFPLAAPTSGWLDVDGSRAEAAPSGRPFVFQWLDDAGVPRATGYVPTGGKVPDYPVAPAKRAHHGPSPLTWAGVGSAVVGLGLYGAAFATHGSYEGAVDSGDAARITSLHGTTNALTIAGVGLLGAGGTLVIVGVL